jgi:hypothetical protein
MRLPPRPNKLIAYADDVLILIAKNKTEYLAVDDCLKRTQ